MTSAGSSHRYPHHLVLHAQPQLWWTATILPVALPVDLGRLEAVLCRGSTDCKFMLQWGRKYSQFSRTPFGQVATTAFVVYLFASGVAFKLLNILFILWWLLPIIALPLARRRNQQVSTFIWLLPLHASIPFGSKCFMEPLYQSRS